MSYVIYFTGGIGYWTGKYYLDGEHSVPRCKSYITPEVKRYKTEQRAGLAAKELCRLFGMGDFRVEDIE
ncbi:hypothetical protein [Planococcus lenghuensis]|uniref:Uncharacterized protein n=1 Tax=Planococcus lenghuensis TaxID=2213202 RepID=A0A1Q2L568_9BACL|nr:hypothetical protein [Planococcus lenghuensis]AQQ55563.1 hypothetical protein B0X71_20530 [Planococcus lenghuensis]